jgi:SAM-dependent methyltransferase
LTLTVHVHESRPGKGTDVLYLEEEDFAVAACPICGNSDHSVLLAEVRAGNRSAVESAYCEKCEHRYHRKMPSPAWIADYYASGWDEGQTTNWGLRRRIRERLKNGPRIGPLYNRIRNFVKGEDDHFRYLRAALEGISEGRGSYLRPNTSCRRILELGCGYGDKLLLFRRLGFTVVGQEASRRRAETCRALGLTVVERDVTDPESELASEAPFDLAFSTHVLEHIPDPLTHIRAVAARVRPGGHVLIEVPNLWQGEGLIRQSHTIAHCHTFSAHSLTTLLRRAGLRPVRANIDINLIVVAQKLTAAEAAEQCQEHFTRSEAPQVLLAPFRGYDYGDHDRFTITYDPARLVVRRESDGSTVREVHSPLATRDFPIKDELSVTLAPDGKDNDFPVRFVHPGDKPPIWVKRQ